MATIAIAFEILLLCSKTQVGKNKYDIKSICLVRLHTQSMYFENKEEIMRKIKTLKKNYEFKDVLSRGKFYIGKQISIYILENNKKYNVIGIAVSTKQCGAVLRNKIKRLIRENYRLIKTNLRQGYDIVFLWNKKIQPECAEYHIIENDMKKIFEKNKMIEESK